MKYVLEKIKDKPENIGEKKVGDWGLEKKGSCKGSQVGETVQ